MKHINETWFRRSVMAILLLVGAALAWAIPGYGLLDKYLVMMIMYAGINIILAVSLNLVNGYMGEFSVGHAGFMAVGAYTASVLSVRLFHLTGPSWLFPVAVLGGGVAAGLAGLILAFPSFKIRGDYLALVTLAFLMIVKSLIENIPYIGGPLGFYGMKKLTTLPWIFFWVVATIWLIRNFIYSKYGRGVMAIRDDEIAANLMGVRTRRVKLQAFTISSFFSGIAGALFAHILLFINPRTFDIARSTDVLVMVYLGGIASITGSILGAILYTTLMELLRPTALAAMFAWLPADALAWAKLNVFSHMDVWRMVVMPLLLILVMLFRPRGIMGLREWKYLVPARNTPDKKQGGPDEPA